ncbi:MAG: hypothetical protein ACRCXB_23505 [Aeromonadaceae bacterium]
MKTPPPPPKKKTLDLEPLAIAKPITKRVDGTLVALNFKVDPAFKRRLKMYALEKDTTMVDVMMNTLNQLMDND